MATASASDRNPTVTAQKIVARRPNASRRFRSDWTAMVRYFPKTRRVLLSVAGLRAGIRTNQLPRITESCHSCWMKTKRKTPTAKITVRVFPSDQKIIGRFPAVVRTRRPLHASFLMRPPSAVNQRNNGVSSSLSLR